MGNWVVDKLVCLQEYYLNLKLMGSILYGMIVLILLVFIVKSLYYQRHEIMAMVLAVTGEVILGAPAIVKLVFELGGWNNFSKDILVKYIVYCVVILLLSVISILRFYKKDSILGDVFSIVIGEIMLGVPFILELLLANNVFDGIVVFFIHKRNEFLVFYNNHRIIGTILIIICGIVFCIIIAKTYKIVRSYKIVRFNVLKKQIASCVYNNSAFKSPDELKKLVKKKFNTSSNIKMGSHVMIEQYVDWLVELNINAISKETCRLISKLGMIEYSELVDILADEFDGLCVDDLDLEICMAIYNNGEIIDVDSTTLVKCPGAKSGETYVRREIRMD